MMVVVNTEIERRLSQLEDAVATIQAQLAGLRAAQPPTRNLDQLMLDEANQCQQNHAPNNA